MPYVASFFWLHVFVIFCNFSFIFLCLSSPFCSNLSIFFLVSSFSSSRIGVIVYKYLAACFFVWPLLNQKLLLFCLHFDIVPPSVMDISVWWWFVLWLLRWMLPVCETLFTWDWGFRNLACVGFVLLKVFACLSALWLCAQLYTMICTCVDCSFVFATFLSYEPF